MRLENGWKPLFQPCRAQKPRIGFVTRSLFESLDLLRLRGHDGGSRPSTGAKHLFREHCLATPDPGPPVPQRALIGKPAGEAYRSE